MKLVKVREEIRQATPEQLQNTLAQLQRQLFVLKINSATTHLKDYSQFKKIRKNIARVLTEQREKHAAAMMAMIVELMQKQMSQEDAQ